MTLDELLINYDKEEAAKRYAEQVGISIDEARLAIAIALGESVGDVMIMGSDGEPKELPRRD